MVQLSFKFCNWNDTACKDFWKDLLNMQASIFISYQNTYIDYDSYDSPLQA
jgi:hypothetical protein